MSSAKGYGLTPLAEADLEEIWRYTAETWSVQQADKYILTLSQIFGLIGMMPMMGREHTEFSPPVRIHVHERHIIVYSPAAPVEIVRVLGARQDWLTILNDAEP